MENRPAILTTQKVEASFLQNRENETGFTEF